MLDTRTLLVNREPVVAFGYLFGTLLVGVAAAGVGVFAAHRLVAGRTT
jgi:fluoride ion exporter CrcB/FEX